MTPALLTAVDSRAHVHLIVGSNSLAGARCKRSLAVGARPILVAPEQADLAFGLRKCLEDSQATWVKRDFRDDDLTSLGREEVDRVVDAVFVTFGRVDPMSGHIAALCRRLRIPVNVVDAPDLCTFTLLSTHTDGPLQIGVTTSGNGCKLASRIQREVASVLPTGLGEAISRLGSLRRRVRDEDHALDNDIGVGADEEDGGQDATFNKLVTSQEPEAANSRRIRWLGQICEYWPLSRLASITDEDIEVLLQNYTSSQPSSSDTGREDVGKVRGKITLAGCGPGNPDLLTLAAHKAILSADLILADKLVPAPILELVPRRAVIHIARKFPGNADRAQEELLTMGLEGVQAGKNVVRLKQGDPYLYGRGAEEFAFFRERGFTATVIPGITSALSAPLFAGIPPTHRSVADEVLVCTGTGRKGAAPDPPRYVPTRTVVFLMALHRLESLVESLVAEETGWPRECPCAVIERASCPDQRIIRTSLEHVCAAVEEEGSRPPGLLVVGRSCEVLGWETGKWDVEVGFRGFDQPSASSGQIDAAVIPEACHDIQG